MTDAKARILIVEDEEGLRASLKAVLEEDGYDVCDAENAFLALELIKASPFEILLVDYRLPDMTGLDLIRQALIIRPDATPIIATGYNSLETAVDAMRAGAHDYMVKPVNIDELKKTLLHILEEREEFRKGQEHFQKVVGEMEYSDDDAIVAAVWDEGYDGQAGEVSGSVPGAVLSSGKDLIRAVKRYFWDIT